MDNIDKVNQRLEKLREFIGVLSSLKGITASDLEKNVDKRALAERYLELAIQTCVDIAELIISDQRFSLPESSSEAIRILGENKVIDSVFADKLSKAVGLRNILVHDYLKVDYEIVASAINNDLSDFDRFSREVSEFLS